MAFAALAVVVLAMPFFWCSGASDSCNHGIVIGLWVAGMMGLEMPYWALF
ncbi:MAG: hypothetical protein KY455_07950 [Euryarchaeota archaeon]|nr:hypothetical protein [Euryarchaeota archaeon]